MWVAIGENLVSNQQIIGIIKHANGKSTPDAMGRLGKTDPPAIATTSVNFIFGDGYIFDISYSHHQSLHLLHHVQNQSLMKISAFHPNGIFAAAAGINMAQKPVQVK